MQWAKFSIGCYDYSMLGGACFVFFFKNYLFFEYFIHVLNIFCSCPSPTLLLPDPSPYPLPNFMSFSYFFYLSFITHRVFHSLCYMALLEWSLPGALVRTPLCKGRRETPFRPPTQSHGWWGSRMGQPVLREPPRPSVGGQDPLQHPWEGSELMTLPRLTGRPPGAAHLLPAAADVFPAIPLFLADQGQLRKSAQNSSLPGPSGLQERPAQKLSRDRRALPCVLAISGSCVTSGLKVTHCARPLYCTVSQD